MQEDPDALAATLQRNEIEEQVEDGNRQRRPVVVGNYLGKHV